MYTWGNFLLQKMRIEPEEVHHPVHVSGRAKELRASWVTALQFILSLPVEYSLETTIMWGAGHADTRQSPHTQRVHGPMLHKGQCVTALWQGLARRYNQGARENREEKPNLVHQLSDLIVDRVINLKAVGRGRHAEESNNMCNKWRTAGVWIAIAEKEVMCTSCVWRQNPGGIKDATNDKAEIFEAMIKLQCSLNWFHILIPMQVIPFCLVWRSGNVNICG